MKRTKHLFTSESVAMGHPDKVADQISDAILDAYIAGDPNSRVACETLVTTGMVMVAGEVTSTAQPQISEVVRETIKEIGYDDPKKGFDYEMCAVLVALGKQSPDISQGVTEGSGLYKEQGAGDQGLMFGFACDETPELMPLPIQLSHQMMMKFAEVRKSGEVDYLCPDGKCQVTVEYANEKPKRVHTVVVSVQHQERATLQMVSKDVIEHIVKPVIPANLLDDNTIYHINPTGRFVVGGPHGDCGLTGRKIIVDTYGGRGCHGGGAFSGKDPSKVDRSASYMARYIAKNIVAAGLAEKCEIQISYAIGIAEPISILVDTEGSAKIDEDKIVKLVYNNFPLKPKEIIDHLQLRRPIFKDTARFGHFGRCGDIFTWEKTDKADVLRKAAGI